MLTRALGFVIVTACAFVAGCGDSGSTATSATPTTSSAGGGSAAGGQVLKVGVLVSGSTSDGGWNQLAFESLHAVSAKEPIDVNVSQQVTKDKAPDAVRLFDSTGYGLVIAHGYEFQEMANELTDPKKGDAVKAKIVVSGGDMDNPNFQSLAYDLAGASYQLGIVAAKVSKNGKLGFIGGEAVPPVEAMKRGFEAGAKSVNPAATVAAQYTGWDDPSKAKKQAEAFMEQGVDVIMQDVDAASRGVFEAVKEHDAGAGSKVYTFGANSDQNENPVCSEYTLGSAVIKMDVAFGNVVKQVKDGTFKGGLVKEDLASGVSVAVLNPKLIGKVTPADAQAAIDAAAVKFKSGELSVPAQ